jgi:hypothetical protein
LKIGGKQEHIDDSLRKNLSRSAFQLIKTSYTRSVHIISDPEEALKTLKAATEVPKDSPEFLLFIAANKNDDMYKSPSFQEVEFHVKKLKRHKAPGIDEIPSELFRSKNFCIELHELISSIWVKRRIPKDWKKSILIDFPKPGGGIRGIALISTAYTVLTKIILSRILSTIMETVGTTQKGFLPGRSTGDAYGSLEIIRQSIIEYGTKAYCLLIDYSKAFDKGNRKAILLLLQNAGIDFRLVELIADTMNKVDKFVVEINLFLVYASIMESNKGVLCHQCCFCY